MQKETEDIKCISKISVLMQQQKILLNNCKYIFKGGCFKDNLKNCIQFKGFVQTGWLVVYFNTTFLKADYAKKKEAKLLMTKKKYILQNMARFKDYRPAERWPVWSKMSTWRAMVSSSLM